MSKILIDALEEIVAAQDDEKNLHIGALEMLYNIHNIATKALSDYASAEKEKFDGHLGRWVKANERLPKKEGQYYINIGGLGDFKKVTYFNGRNFEHQFTNRDFEWLDETHNPNTCEVAFCGWPHKCDTPPTKESGGDDVLRQDINDIIYKQSQEIQRLKALVSDTATELQERINTGLTEIERLKGLVKKMYNADKSNFDSSPAVNKVKWEQFSKQNGLT